MTSSRPGFSLVLRYLQFFAGVFFMALGVVLTTKADIGTTPISALPYVASLGLPPSLGLFTVLLNVVLVALQVLIMKSKFPREQYLQLPASILFGLFIDFWMHFSPDPAGYGYAEQLLFLASGTVILAFGVFVEVSANVVMMAGEGVVMVLSLTTHRDFGLLKTAFDVTLVLLGVLLSFLLFQELRGIREGTLLSALFVGQLVRFFFAMHRKLTG